MARLTIFRGCNNSFGCQGMSGHIAFIAESSAVPLAGGWSGFEFAATESAGIASCAYARRFADDASFTMGRLFVSSIPGFIQPGLDVTLPSSE
jgi:hypothetical protein